LKSTALFPWEFGFIIFEEDNHVIQVFNGATDYTSMLFFVKGAKWTLTIDENVHIASQSALFKYHWNFYHFPFIMKTPPFLKIWFPGQFNRYPRRFLEKF
jgi:hypothetical protein